MTDSGIELQIALRKALQGALGTQADLADFDVDVIPIPAQAMKGDRMVRLRTLEEVLQDFDGNSDAPNYLIQVKPRRNAPTTLPASEATADSAFSLEELFAARGGAPTPRPTGENVYLPDGKLNVAYLMRNAEILTSSGEFTLARNIYKAISQSGGRTAAANFGIGKTYEAEGKLEEARISYEESIAYQPDTEVYQRLANVLIRQKKDQHAAEVLERALAQRDIPSRVRFELHKACADCWMRIQHHADAERHFNRALEIDPSADATRASLGALCLQANKVAEARRHFQDAVAANPRNARALAGLGSCFLAEGDKRAAHDCFAKSLNEELNNPTAVFYLVKCAYEIKSYATAARVLEEYIQIAPINMNLLYSLAGLQFHLGRIEEARATAKKILELSPQHAGARELLTTMERFSTN